MQAGGADSVAILTSLLFQMRYRVKVQLLLKAHTMGQNLVRYQFGIISLYFCEMTSKSIDVACYLIDVSLLFNYLIIGTCKL